MTQEACEGHMPENPSPIGSPLSDPKKRLTDFIFFVFILMETESGFEVKHLVCFG